MGNSVTTASVVIEKICSSTRPESHRQDIFGGIFQAFMSLIMLRDHHGHDLVEVLLVSSSLHRLVLQLVFVQSRVVS